MSHDTDRAAADFEPSMLIEFFGGLPHWTAEAGLSPAGAEVVADELERLVETVQSAGYPPRPIDGPEPSSFPPPSNRIAAAGTQLVGLLRGLDDAAWSHEVGARPIIDHCRSTVAVLQDQATS